MPGRGETAAGRSDPSEYQATIRFLGEDQWAQEHCTCESMAAHSIPEALNSREVQGAPRLHNKRVPIQHL